VERKTLFVDLILPLALQNLYTYRVPFELNDEVKIGKRVVVQFGKTKIYSAVIAHIHSRAPNQYQAKYILSILDDSPVVNELQLKHWQWIASYYMCTVGEVMNAALPVGLKLASETRIDLNREYTGEHALFNDKEFLITEALEIHGTLTINEIVKILDQKTVMPLVKSLIDKGVVLVREELIERFRPKKQSFVRLAHSVDNEDRLKAVFDSLEKAPKQLEMLMAFVHLSHRYDEVAEEVPKLELIRKTNSNSNIFNQLVKKEVFEIYEKEIGRLPTGSLNVNHDQELVLSDAQKIASYEILDQFKKKDVVLLHGVTSSGKTEIYITHIKKVLKKKKQVLYLLPEIALTAQIIHRLQRYFGNRVGVYHSKFNENERVEIWNATLNSGKEKYDIILGARSALFLPFENLGLVIVDEEHENTFKQYNPSPRYHARDAAIYLAGLHKAKTLLGTATPAIETYANARKGKFGLVELNERYGNVQLPELLIVNAGEEKRKNRMKSNFSPLLLDLIGKAISASEQVILFQNRRGFSSFLECGMCSWIPTCINCDVTLTYHKAFGVMKCHYCGYSTDVPAKCGACGNANIQTRGFGTEMVEEDLVHFFPEVRVARMDLDSTRSKNAYQKIIGDFENRIIDVLIGTQMVTKGLDFDNVSVVGILNADTILGFPDFRSFERGYQLMAQVSGRAGRKKKRGKVVVQSYHPEHHVIQKVLKNDYVGMFEEEINHREKFKYPPFHRLIGITLKHKDRNTLDQGAVILQNLLYLQFGARLLGPEYPLIARVRNQYNKCFLLKLEVEVSNTKAKEILQAEIDKFKKDKLGKSIRVLVDVDPM